MVTYAKHIVMFVKIIEHMSTTKGSKFVWKIGKISSLFICWIVHFMPFRVIFYFYFLCVGCGNVTYTKDITVFAKNQYFHICSVHPMIVDVFEFIKPFSQFYEDLKCKSNHFNAYH